MWEWPEADDMQFLSLVLLPNMYKNVLWLWKTQLLYKNFALKGGCGSR